MPRIRAFELSSERGRPSPFVCKQASQPHLCNARPGESALYTTKENEEPVPVRIALSPPRRFPLLLDSCRLSLVLVLITDPSAAPLAILLTLSPRGTFDLEVVVHGVSSLLFLQHSFLVPSFAFEGVSGSWSRRRCSVAVITGGAVLMLILVALLATGAVVIVCCGGRSGSVSPRSLPVAVSAFSVLIMVVSMGAIPTRSMAAVTLFQVACAIGKSFSITSRRLFGSRCICVFPSSVA